MISLEEPSEISPTRSNLPVIAIQSPSFMAYISVGISHISVCVIISLMSVSLTRLLAHDGQEPSVLLLSTGRA